MGSNVRSAEVAEDAALGGEGVPEATVGVRPKGGSFDAIANDGSPTLKLPAVLEK